MQPEPLVGGRAVCRLGGLRAGPSCCGGDPPRAQRRSVAVGMGRQRSRAVRAIAVSRTARRVALGAVLQRVYS